MRMVAPFKTSEPYKLRPSFLLASFVLLVGFLFGMFLLQNLPFTFGDDLNNIHFAKHTSWSVLLREVVNPFTPAWYVHGGKSLLATRSFEILLFKGLVGMFGYLPNAFWSLKAIGYAGSGAAICLLLSLFTRNLWIGFAGSIFFFVYPPVYETVSWISDSEILAEFCVLVTFFTYMYLYIDQKKRSLTQILPLIVIMISISWLGMKLRETARMVPFILAAFLIIHQNTKIISWIRESKKNVVLAITPLFLFLPVIPWRKIEGSNFDSRSDNAIFQLDFGHWVYVMPMLAQLVLGIFIFAGLAFCIMLLIKSARRDTPARSISQGSFLFLAIWTGTCLAAFLLNFPIENNHRYLTTPLIPLTILGFALYWRGTTLLTKRVASVIHIFFAIFVGMSAQKNLDEVIFNRVYHGGTTVADYVLTKKIYEDRFRVGDASWSELVDFYRGSGPVNPDSREVKVKAWDENVGLKLTPKGLEEIASRWGAAYVLSFDGDLFPNEPQIEVLLETTTANDSVLSRLLPRIKKKTSRPAFLYKYSASA